MTDITRPSSPRDDGAALVAQVQGLGFDSARVVVSRFTEMFERFQAGLGAALAGGASGLPVTAATGGASEPGELLLPGVTPGCHCSARLWLHNPTASSSSGLRFWLPGLLTHDGQAMDAAAVTFNPPNVARIEPNSSIEILVTLTVPLDACSGRYHGQILVEGQPETSLPISFNVLARGDR